MSANKILISHNTIFYLYIHYRKLIKRLLENNFEVVILAPRDEYADSFERLGIRCIDIKMSRKGLNPFSEFATLIRFRRIIFRETPDILLNFSIKPILYCSLASRSLETSRVYSMVTGLGYTFVPGGLRKLVLKFIVTNLYRIALKKNEYIFFQNGNDEQSFLTNRIIPSNCSSVLPGAGVDLKKYSPSEQPFATDRFVMISRIIAEKGIQEFVAAAKIVKGQHKKTSFTLAGYLDNAQASTTNNKLSKCLSEDAINFVGRIRDVPPLLRKSSVFIFPSYYREGLPSCLVEAMACGLPIITSDIPGCRDCVEEGVNGFLIPPRDVPALVEAILKFIVNPSLIQTMGAKSRTMAVQKFDVGKVNDIILNKIMS